MRHLSNNSVNDNFRYDDQDDWCFTANFIRMVWQNGNEANSKMKQPSEMATQRFEHG